MNIFRPKAEKPTAVSKTPKPVPKYCPAHGCPLREQEYIASRRFDMYTGEGTETYYVMLRCTYGHCTWEYLLSGQKTRPAMSKCP
jgi:hypothetical protein